MQSNLNWGDMFTRGRCKAIGIPWSDEELHALYIEKVPAEYVREGILTHADYEKATKKEEKKEEELGGVLLKKLSKKELAELALENGVKVTESASKEVLIQELNKKGIEYVEK